MRKEMYIMIFHDINSIELGAMFLEIGVNNYIYMESNVVLFFLENENPNNVRDLLIESFKDGDIERENPTFFLAKIGDGYSGWYDKNIWKWIDLNLK